MALSFEEAQALSYSFSPPLEEEEFLPPEEARLREEKRAEARYQRELAAHRASLPKRGPLRRVFNPFVGTCLGLLHGLAIYYLVPPTTGLWGLNELFFWLFAVVFTLGYAVLCGVACHDRSFALGALLLSVPFFLLLYWTYGIAWLTLPLFLFLVACGLLHRSEGEAPTPPKQQAPGEASQRGAAPAEALQAVHGQAGALIGGKEGAYGEAAAVGQHGEEALGRLLASFVKRHPFVRVVHGVTFAPGKAGADIDHVVLVGREVFLLDSKQWAGGAYSWDAASGEVLRKLPQDALPHGFSGGGVKLAAAWDLWRGYLPKACALQEVLIVVAGAPSRYQVSNDHAPEHLRLCTKDGLLEVLEAAAKRSEHVVDRKLLQAVLTQHHLQEEARGSAS